MVTKRARGRGPGGRKRSNRQRALDLIKVGKLHLQGKNQYEIAEVIGVTQAQINHDLKELRRRWSAQLDDTVRAVAAERIECYRQIIAAAWEAWHRSIQKSKKIRVSERLPKLLTQDATAKTGEKTTQVETIDRAGDPRLLQVITQANEAMAKLQLWFNEKFGEIDLPPAGTGGLTQTNVQQTVVNPTVNIQINNKGDGSTEYGTLEQRRARVLSIVDGIRKRIGASGDRILIASGDEQPDSGGAEPT